MVHARGCTARTEDDGDTSFNSFNPEFNDNSKGKADLERQNKVTDVDKRLSAKRHKGLDTKRCLACGEDEKEVGTGDEVVQERLCHSEPSRGYVRQFAELFRRR